jgi:cytochrome c peroxidase
MKVFFSKSMALDTKDTACVSCHHPALGGGDALSLPIGVEAERPEVLGVGRSHSITGVNHDGGPTVPRNAPTTFNIALWNRVLFHDGRIEATGPAAGNSGAKPGIRTPESKLGTADLNAGHNLAEAQARFPITSAEEMRGFNDIHGDDNDAVRRSLIGNNMAPEWDAEFDAVYGGSSGIAGTDPNNPYARVAEVLGFYQRSQVFVNNAWKDYVEGDEDAITESAKRGALLFFNSYEAGGANCAQCHSGDFFTDEEFHVYAAPQIGRGKGDESGTGWSDNDFGRFRETGLKADMFAFRTPTLLNVAVTGPWTHAGAYTTLESVILHKTNPAKAIAEYDFSQLNPSLQASNMITNTQAALDSGLDASIQVIELSVAQVADIVAFLETLTDPCVVTRECIARWIPDAGIPNPDGLRLNAIDLTGNPL